MQGEHPTWLFRTDDFSFQTQANIGAYTAATAGISDLAAWKFDPDSNNLSGIRLYSSEQDEQDMVYLSWDLFKANYRFGAARLQVQRPSTFSVKPDMSLDFWPIPDAAYTVNGEYIKRIATMAENDDEPILPDFHMIIVWRALMYYGAFQGAPEAFAHGQNEYRKLLARLEENQLPKVQWGPPLA